MKRILSALKEKWPEYILEIIVLVIGIFIAFELNNYGENQKRKKVEIEILKGCKAELQSDLKDIDLNINDFKKSLFALETFIDLLENDGQYHDSLAALFNYTLLPIHFVHSTSAFETLKSKGLDIISNPDIRTKLVKVYDSQYDFFLQAESEELDEVHYGLRHIFPGRFESGLNFPKSNFDGELIPLDFEALKSDIEFLYFIKTQRNRTQSYLDYFYANLKEDVETMISDLDTELKRLE